MKLEIRKGVMLAFSNPAIFSSSQLVHRHEGRWEVNPYWDYESVRSLVASNKLYLKQKGEFIGRILGSPTENRARITAGQWNGP